MVAVENVKVHAGDCRMMASNTFAISLDNGVKFIKFAMPDEEADKLMSEYGCMTLNIVGKCKQNIWNGNVYPQIEMTDYEIVGEQKYYF